MMAKKKFGPLANEHIATWVILLLDVYPVTVAGVTSVKENARLPLEEFRAALTVDLNAGDPPVVTLLEAFDKNLNPQKRNKDGRRGDPFNWGGDAKKVRECAHLAGQKAAEHAVGNTITADDVIVGVQYVRSRCQRLAAWRPFGGYCDY